jgi:phosphoglycolate phosphatase-like HAD superfamily hydrolase
LRDWLFDANIVSNYNHREPFYQLSASSFIRSPMNKLLLFDIDGTLVSVEREASRQLLRDVVRETIGVVLPAGYVFHLGGKTDFQIMTEIASEFDVPLSVLKAKRALVKERLISHTERLSSVAFVNILAGVQALLEALSVRDDVTLGLLTGNIKQTAYLKLRPYRMDMLFPFGAFGCDHIERTELPPIAIHRANAHTQGTIFTPRNTIIIGDTLNDIACARAHGIPVVSVATGPISYERLAEEQPDYVVRDFSNTVQILEILTS